MTLVVNWATGPRPNSLKRLHPRCGCVSEGITLLLDPCSDSGHTTYKVLNVTRVRHFQTIRTKSTYLFILSFLLSGRTRPRDPLLRFLEVLTHSGFGLALFAPCSLRLFSGSYRGFIEDTYIRKVLFLFFFFFFYFFFFFFFFFGLTGPWSLACQ
jgi:hypothetical protein